MGIYIFLSCFLFMKLLFKSDIFTFNKKLLKGSNIQEFVLYGSLISVPGGRFPRGGR